MADQHQQQMRPKQDGLEHSLPQCCTAHCCGHCIACKELYHAMYQDWSGCNIQAATNSAGLLQRQDSGAAQSGSWAEPDATTFMVRGSDYMKSRKKVNSDKAIYRCEV